jgi:hypothetical protein
MTHDYEIAGKARGPQLKFTTIKKVKKQKKVKKGKKKKEIYFTG